MPSGSAATWVDLHSYLSNIFTESNANGVWSDGATTFVVGWGFNSVTHRTEALMWLGIGVRPPCRPDFNHNGMVTVSDIFDFLAAWFQGNPSADINGQGLSVSDIFAFLSAWFMGCP